MYARMASGLFLALGLADLAVLNLVLAPRLAHGEATPCVTGLAAVAAPGMAVGAALAAESARLAASPAPEARPSPAAAPPAPAEPRLVPAAPDVTFSLGEVRVTSTADVATVQRVARELSAAEGKRLVVRGHSDRLGSPVVNRLLSWQRAEAVTRLLAWSGAPLDRISIEAAGSSDPADASDTPSGWAKNRRVQLLWR